MSDIGTANDLLMGKDGPGRGVVSRGVRRQSDWLAVVGLPETLLHGDFHVFNVIERHGER